MDTPSAHWDILKQDLRYTIRTLARARGFALTAILVTALGVGANTAAFSVADFVLLRPLPFPEPDALVRVCEGPRTGGGWGCMNQLSPANYRDFKRMNASFEDLGAFTQDSVNLVGGGDPRRLAIARVTPEVLSLLGVTPALGRVFAATGTDDVSAAVIGYGLWQSHFAGSTGHRRSEDQSQRQPLHDRRRDAPRVLLPDARCPVVGAADAAGKRLRQSHEYLSRRHRTVEARHHLRTGQGRAHDARRTPRPRLPRHE